MSARSLSLLVLALLLLAPLAAAGGHGGRMQEAREAARAQDDSFAAHPGRDAALAKAEDRGLFAKWNRDGDRVYGRFVSFNVSDATGTIMDFAYRNGTTFRPIFAQLTIADFTKDASAPGQGARVVGSILRVFGTDGALRMHNNPTAGLRFQNGDVERDVTFLLAAGATAASLGDANKSLRVNLSGFAHTDHAHVVVSDGSIEKTATSIKVHLGKNATLGFLVHPKGADAVTLHGTVSALASGRLGAEARIVVVNGKPVGQADQVDVAVTPIEASAKRFVFNASGNATSPRVVVVTLPRADFSGFENGTMEVRVGNVKAGLVSSANVFTSSAAAASVDIGADVITLIVAIPHFSTQTVTVESVEPAGDGDAAGGIPGFAVLGALAALGVAALRRRG